MFGFGVGSGLGGGMYRQGSDGEAAGQFGMAIEFKKKTRV